MHAGAHDALALIFIRLALPRATTGAGFLAKMPVAKQAVQPARRKHIDIVIVRWFHACSPLAE
jgi:hypothetical protein